MKFALGVALVILGIALGAYVGIWVCFVGGILDILQEIVDQTYNLKAIGIGVTKMILASLAGYISAIIAILPGWALIQNSK